MRISLVAVIAGVAMAPVPALAVENFIPLGHNYSPDDSVIPEFNSEQDQLNGQVDIYETEIYTRQRFAKENNTYVRRFLNSQSGTGGSMDFIDY
jgi:hypothetical protein